MHVSSAPSKMIWKNVVLGVIGVLLFLLYSPTLLDIRPSAYSIPLVPLRGPLEVNDKLSRAEHLFQNSISGPESIVVHDGYVYTGIEGGRILKIHDDKIVAVAQTGQECHLPYEERLCGRPLGLRMGKDGQLYVLDAYYGLLRMNFSTGLLTRLLPASVPIEGQKITFPDDMDIDEKGNVYITDASAKWDLSNMYYLVTEHDASGRVIRFNVYTGESEVLLRNLHFPNGVQISHDGNSLLICEISRRRILRYYLKGQKKGQIEVFVDRLPGEPDNIRLSSRGGYWVALLTAWNETQPQLINTLTNYPLIRRIIARTQHSLGSLLMAVGDILSSHAIKEFGYKVKRGDVLYSLVPKYGIAIELDDNGNIIRTLQAPDGSISSLSQVTEHDGYLYLGSFLNPYLGRLKL